MNGAITVWQNPEEFEGKRGAWFKMGLTSGIMGGAIGLGAGALESAFKEEPSWLLNKANEFGLKGLKTMSSGAIRNLGSRLFQEALNEGNLPGKIAIAGTEYSLDSALGEGNNAFEGLSRFLWGKNFLP